RDLEAVQAPRDVGQRVIRTYPAVRDRLQTGRLLFPDDLPDQLVLDGPEARRIDLATVELAVRGPKLERPTGQGRSGIRANEGCEHRDSVLGLRAGTPCWDSVLGLGAGTPCCRSW